MTDGNPQSAVSAQSPKYKADVPDSLITPDKVQTELLGELDFKDGMPSEVTVKKTYDFIDLSRAVDAFHLRYARRPQAGWRGTRRLSALGKSLRCP
jgi:hypothetical protein